MAFGWISLFGNPNPFDGNSGIVPYKLLNAGSTQNPNIGSMHESNDSMFEDAVYIDPEFGSDPRFRWSWSSETVAGDVFFGFQHRVTDDTELLDIITSPTERVDTLTHTADLANPSAQVTSEIDLTDTDWVKDGLLTCKLWRRAGTEAGDDKADKISIWAAGIRYIVA